MKGPTRPATRARSADAINACWTKSRPSKSAVTSNAKTCASRSASRSFMRVPHRVTGVVDVLADDDVATVDLHHLNVGTVQLRQGVRGHHLGDGANPKPAIDEVEHPINIGQNRIHLVGDEEHCGVGVSSPLV